MAQSPSATTQLQRILQQAAQLHGAGKLSEAEPLYRQVLARDAENFDALHLYGVLLSQTQRFNEAETFLRRAAHRGPNVAVVHSNLGNFLRERGRPDEALPHLRRAVALDPKMAAAHQNLGVVLKLLEMKQEAEACFQKAVSLQPNFPEALSSLGGALRESKNLEDSEGCYRKALAMRPDYAEALSGLGATLGEMKRTDESLDCCRRAVALRPDHAEARNNLAMALLARKAYSQAEAELHEALRLRGDYADARGNLGTVLTELRRLEDALIECRKAVELQPGKSQHWVNLGSALRRLRRFDEAEDACRRAIELNPTSPLEHYNLGVVHLDQCEITQAIVCFRRAIELKPQDGLAHWGLALALLVDGQYLEGWKEYERRWECTEIFPARPTFAQPPWNGQEAKGKTLLVYSEQGLGDAIQFARYVPLLARRGANVILQCQPSLKALLATLPGAPAIHCQPEPLPDFDFHCSLLSLPRIMGTTVETIPAGIPYLSAEPALANAWRQRLATISAKWKVGIAWAGNPDHQRDFDRSCGLAALAPLASVPDVALISLQKGPAAAETATPPPGMTLHDFTSDLATFAETAALIANLDLVIAVDTSVAHLAGALGKPVWTLLAFAPDWRWLLNRNDSPWYPTMRLFRQTTPGDWTDVIQIAAGALRKFAGGA